MSAVQWFWESINVSLCVILFGLWGVVACVGESDSENSSECNERKTACREGDVYICKGGEWTIWSSCMGDETCRMREGEADCAPDEGASSDPERGTGSDGDTDEDVNGDTDADSDVDTDSDADSESDSDVDADSDVDGDSDADADNDTDADADNDTDADVDNDTDADADNDTDADADTDTDTDADTDSDSDTDTDNANPCDGGFDIREGAYVCAGAWKGYAWPGGGDNGGDVRPSDFSGYNGSETQLCIDGSLGRSYSSVAMLGMGINQTEGDTSTPGWGIGPYTGIYVSYSNPGGSAVRIIIRTVMGDEYCAEPEAGGDTVDLDAFLSECWSDSGLRYVGEPIEMVMLLVPGDEAKTVTFDLCLNEMYPVPKGAISEFNDLPLEHAGACGKTDDTGIHTCYQFYREIGDTVTGFESYCSDFDEGADCQYSGDDFSKATYTGVCGWLGPNGSLVFQGYVNADERESYFRNRCRDDGGTWWARN